MNYFDVTVAYANSYFAKKDFNKALVLMLAAEIINTDSPGNEQDSSIESILKIENFKGQCFLELQDYESARYAFESVLEKKPETSEAHAGLGLIYWNTGDSDKTLQHFSRAFQIEPENRTGLIYYSRVLKGLGKIDEAIGYCIKYLQSHPQDTEILEIILELAEVEKVKSQVTTPGLILITGTHGAGKSTYGKTLGYPVLHIDHFFNYATQVMNYDGIRTLFDLQAYVINKGIENVVLDAYLLKVDPQLKKLKGAIAPVNNIKVKLVYTGAEELYNSQRSTEERTANVEKEQLAKEEHLRWNQKRQLDIYNKFTDLLNSNHIAGIEFIYRDGNTYYPADEKHFLDTIGEVKDWSRNKYELLEFVRENETQAYQTIEFDGEIIRPGTEQCWISWENISKFNINWKDKFVCDIGSYFGYFSLQALKSGAKKVLGIDQNSALLNVYGEVLRANKYSNFETKPIMLGNGSNIPDTDYDIIMALNMLHHIQKSTTPAYYNEVLESIFRNTKEVVLEINDYQVNEIKAAAKRFGFDLKGELTSHRSTMYGQRYLFYYSKL